MSKRSEFIEVLPTGWRFWRGFEDHKDQMPIGADEEQCFVLSWIAGNATSNFTSYPGCEYVDYVTDPLPEDQEVHFSSGWVGIRPSSTAIPAKASRPLLTVDEYWKDSTRRSKRPQRKSQHLLSDEYKTEYQIREQKKSEERLHRLQRFLEDEGAFRCDNCDYSYGYKRLRVQFKEGAPVGHFCTDCFYTVADAHGRSDRLQYGRHQYRKPTLSDQEEMSHDALAIRYSEHRDLRWEYGFLGKITGKYRLPLTRRYHWYTRTDKQCLTVASS